MNKANNVHGTGLLLDTTGLLIRGPSGSGKSVLALALLDQWDARGFPAFLVADDQVELAAVGSDLNMRAPDAIAGLIELRGRGIISRPYRSPVPLNLVIDLVPDLVRMPQEADFVTEIGGVAMARAPVPNAGVVGVTHQILLVAEAIAALTRRVGRP
jgi:serine kinase of HPr protein (carbohydrate metabolism regulator)